MKPLLFFGRAAFGAAGLLTTRPVSGSAETKDAEVGGRPDSPQADGFYGRFDGDLDLSAAVGGSLVRGGSGLSAVMRIFFLETAGMYVGYDDALGHATAAPSRSFAIGVGIRPL